VLTKKNKIKKWETILERRYLPFTPQSTAPLLLVLCNDPWRIISVWISQL